MQIRVTDRTTKNTINSIIFNFNNFLEAHHPHKAGHNKNQKEFITEYFMLFFAIILEFFAENIRQIYIGCFLQKEYMQTMVQDLK